MCLRGLTIILMLMNLTPGSWEYNYPFLVHAKWEGWTLIDMVAPAFLFCIGAAMPLSLERARRKAIRAQRLLRHVLWRGALLVAIGLFLNLYPTLRFRDRSGFPASCSASACVTCSPARSCS